MKLEINDRETKEFIYVKLGREPLPWTKRVQIALDSARGLEYIHEHTVPVYVHRDIKSANILIDQSFRAKVCSHFLIKLKLCYVCFVNGN